MEAVVGSVDFSMCVYLYVRREGCICPVILLRVVLMQCLSFIYVLCIPAVLSPAFFLIHMLCQCLLLSRFGKKKEEKKEAKAALQRQKSDLLSDHELERMKEERERWGGFYP